ncbi:unnamed protein product [Rotaria sp. Silwood1]|nr:unnamed protein product [Rotaria sp. Silwood1]
MSSSESSDDATKERGIYGGHGGGPDIMTDNTRTNMKSGNGSGDHAGISEVRGNDTGHGVSSSGMDDSTGDGSWNMPQRKSGGQNSNLGGSVFQSPAATAKIDNRTYLSTYNTFDSKAIPYFFLIMIDVETKTIKLNLSLIEKNDYAGFYHIGVTNENGNIYGVRESFKSPLGLEVAKINQTTGLMKTIGIYPTGSFSVIMAFAPKRRLYYNVIDSTLYGINIDTGKLDVHSQMPGDYSIYGLDYDSAKDRLIAIIYPGGLNDGVWYLVEVIMKAKGELEFDRIGKSEIPFEKYFWSTNYALDAEKRLWVTLWGTTDDKKNYFFVFNIDNGKIVEQTAISLTELSKWHIFSSRKILPIKVRMLLMISLNKSLSSTIDSITNIDLLGTTEVGPIT